MTLQGTYFAIKSEKADPEGFIVPFDQQDKIWFNQPTKGGSKPSANTAIFACAHFSRAKKLSRMKGRHAHSGEALAKSETFRQ